jgi:hypothetical protein
MTLLQSTLRTYLGAHGLEWEAYLGGGILGKAITDALKQRLAAGEKPVVWNPGKALKRFAFLNMC